MNNKPSNHERERFDHLGRVLHPADSASFDALDETERWALRRLYWLFADPLWSREGNEPRLEFLARMTFVELRFSLEERLVRGADSDRGGTYVRYGPPGMVMPYKDIVQFGFNWIYATGLQFFFRGYDTFVFTDPGWVAKVIEIMPVRWDNIEPIRVDSMPARVARFRAEDSVDVLVSALAPVARIASLADVIGPVRSDFWLLSGGTVVTVRDSATSTDKIPTTYRMRVEPGTYVYRAEASADASPLAARSTAVVNALKQTLLGAGDLAVIEDKSTENVDAYAHYLRGKFHIRGRQKDDLQKAQDEFQLAIIGMDRKEKVMSCKNIIFRPE